MTRSAPHHRMNGEGMLFSVSLRTPSDRAELFFHLAMSIVVIIGTFGLYATLINFGPFALDQYKQNAKQTPPLAINSTSAEYESIRNVTTTGRDHSKTLGIASEIFVVSLPRRADRRDQMEILRVALDLQWMYVDAVESTGTEVENIMTRIIMLRGMETSRRKDVGNFQWPQNIDALSSSSQP